MRKSFILISLLAFLVQTFYSAALVFNFQIHQDIISKTICIKKNISGNSCQGKCHLKKLLSEAEKKENSSPLQSLKKIKEVELFHSTQYNFFHLPITRYALFSLPGYDLYNTCGKGIFHPPNSSFLYC